MAKKRIDSIFDLEAIKKEIAVASGEVNGFLDGIEESLKGLSSTKVKIGDATNFKELSTAQQQYNAYIKDTDRIKTQLLNSEKKLQEAESTYAKIIASNRAELQKTNAELKNRVQYEQANTGSIEKARAAVALLNKERNKLNLYTEEGVARQKELNAQIDKYNAFIKKNVDQLSQQKINIGNYAGALAAPFETLIKKVEELRSNLSKGIGIGGKTDVDSINKANQAITIIQGTIDKSSASGTTSVKQVKNLTNAYRDLSLTLGKADGTTFLSGLSLQVGEAKDAVADLGDEIKLNASDTKGIENVTGSLNVLAGIAQGAAGAYALLGASEEDAAKVTAKLIAVQGIVNSIQQVGTELTKQGTTANKAYVYVQGLVAVATNSTATASSRLNAILKLSTIGIFVAAIGTLIYAFTKASEITSTLGKNLATLSDISKKATESYSSEAVNLKLLVSEYQNVNTSVKRKKEIQDQLQKDYPAYFANLKTEAEFQNGIADAADRATKALFIQAKIQAAQGILSDKYKELLQKQFDPKTAITFADKAKSAFRDLGSTFNTLFRPGAISVDDLKDLDKRAQNNIGKAKKEYESFESFITKFVTDSNAELQKLGGDPKKATDPKKDTNKSTVDAKKIADNTAADILKSQYELNKIIIERSAAKDKEIFENEANSFDDRLNALKAFFAKQAALVELDKQFELSQEALKLAAIKASLAEQAKEKGADIKGLKEQEAREIEASNKRIEVIEAKSYDNLVAATSAFNKELKRLKDERQQIRDDERKQIEDYEEFTLSQINKARAAQIAANKKWDDDEKAREDKANDDLKNAKKQLYQELLTTIEFFLTAGIDKQIATIDTQKRLLDEETARRINQIELLGLTEQERVKKTAEVNKQAAYENEQLEKKRRKLLVERARFEKLANIASIISSTAQAVIGALGQKPWTPLNISLAAVVGGIGALQLARAVAAPLPQYFKGTDNAKKGLAMVSEKGSELMKKNGQYYLTPSQPTLMEMAGGEQITPAHVTKDILGSIMWSKKMMAGGLTQLQPVGMSSSQADIMISEIKGLRKSVPQIMIQNQRGIESTAYYINNIKK